MKKRKAKKKPQPHRNARTQLITMRVPLGLLDAINNEVTKRQKSDDDYSRTQLMCRATSAAIDYPDPYDNA